MPEPEPTAEPTPTGAAPGALGRKTTSGFAWLTAQTLGAKVVSTAAQIVLARLLVPDDFGLFALALTVVQFAQLLHGYGMREVLIRLHDEFEAWASPAFWMTVLGGLVSGAAVFAFAGPAAIAYAEPELAPILRFVAIAMPLTALVIVPTAALEIRIRYRALAITQFLTAVVQFSASIVLAFLGLGVWSLVIPLVCVRAITLVVLFALARPPIRLNPEFARWSSLLRDVGLLTLAGLLTTAVLQGDYIVLGLFVTSAQVGLYYIAYQLSRQPLMLIAQNFSRVLLPAFSHLKNNPERQRTAFIDATSLLAFVLIPVCVIAAALAEPVITLAFGPEYEGSVVLFAILSLGSAFRGGVESGAALLRAQGRFGTVLRLRYVLTPLFFLLLTSGIVLYGVVGGAIGVGISALITGIVQPAVAMRPIGGGLRDSIGLVLAPFTISLAAGAVAFAVGLFTPETVPGYVAHLLIGGAAGSVVFIVLAWLTMRRTMDALIARLAPYSGPLRRFASG